MYDPTVGRWLELDPSGFDAGDDNLYRYVRNNATSLTDPTGLAAAKPETDRMKLNEAWKLSETAVGKEKRNEILKKLTYKIGDKMVSVPESIFDTDKLDKTIDDTSVEAKMDWLWGVAAVRIKVKDYNGMVMQVAHTKLIANYKEGEPRTLAETYAVEAFRVKNGLAEAPDIQISGDAFPAAERRKLVSLVWESDFTLAAADKYKKKDIPSKPYALLEQRKDVPNPDDLGWTGERLFYKVTFKWDVAKAEGAFVFPKMKKD
jgi:uncharacterized protein RhaS with RHS repeats